MRRIVFVVRNGCVLTSHVVACPEGITRATVLEICAANEIRAAKRADGERSLQRREMFCTGTMGELAAVTSIDGRSIGSGEVGG
jgi:branched-chain amino acid aminotransferase